MKLAQALQERSDLQTRLRQLEERLCQNATVQEGEVPAEDPAALLEEDPALEAPEHRALAREVRILASHADAPSGG